MKREYINPEIIVVEYAPIGLLAGSPDPDSRSINDIDNEGQNGICGD